MVPARQLTKQIIFLCMALVTLGGLYIAHLNNYLLFHSLAELFAVVIACGMFMIAWNVREVMKNHYLLFLGTAYLFVGGLDLVHTLAYKGMPMLQQDGANTATQLWIAARYMESLSLLASPLLLTRRISINGLLAGYSIVFSLVILSIFYWRIFPDCFVDETGLTVFKIYSEYLISLILIGAMALLYKFREQKDPTVLRWVLVSIGLTVASELTFTTYAQAYGFANLIGHYLKLLSFYCIYKALIEIGLTRPYSLLFHELKNSEQALQRARRQLEKKVRERTADLQTTVEVLSGEVKRRLKAENMLRRLSRKSIDALESDRKSVAKELHDSIGASLAAIKFILEEVRAGLEKTDGNQLQGVQKAIYFLADTIQESKRISARLRPMTLEELGLLSTIEAYSRQFEDLDAGIHIERHITAEEGQIPDHLKIVIYRILQEALNNIRRHSRAGKVWIRLSADDHSVHFALRDNGVGFDMDRHIPPDRGLHGYGLQSMRERTELLGGCFSLSSRPGKGTCIQVDLPCAHSETAESDRDQGA